MISPLRGSFYLSYFRRVKINFRFNFGRVKTLFRWVKTRGYYILRWVKHVVIAFFDGLKPVATFIFLSVFSRLSLLPQFLGNRRSLR